MCATSRLHPMQGAVNKCRLRYQRQQEMVSQTTWMKRPKCLWFARTVLHRSVPKGKMNMVSGIISMKIYAVAT
uniref:Uncharacterized protein n=1 Tax=Arundo donax TaxID=35708 RepID=A0A0A8YMZ3_ARUDO